MMKIIQARQIGKVSLDMLSKIIVSQAASKRILAQVRDALQFKQDKVNITPRDHETVLNGLYFVMTSSEYRKYPPKLKNAFVLAIKYTKQLKVVAYNDPGRALSVANKVNDLLNGILNTMKRMPKDV